MAKVFVPSADFRMDVNTTVLWDVTGAFLLTARKVLQDDSMALSVVLSRVARELRRDYGTDEARAIFQQMAETMEEASKNDRL